MESVYAQRNRSYLSLADQVLHAPVNAPAQAVPVSEA